MPNEDFLQPDLDRKNIPNQAASQNPNDQKNKEVRGSAPKTSLLHNTTNDNSQVDTSLNHTTNSRPSQDNSGEKCKKSENILSGQSHSSQVVNVETVETAQKVSDSVATNGSFEQFVREEAAAIIEANKDAAMDWIREQSEQFRDGAGGFDPDFEDEDARQYFTRKQLESILLQWQVPKWFEDKGIEDIQAVHLHLTYIHHHDPHYTASFDEKSAEVLKEKFAAWRDGPKSYRQGIKVAPKKTPEQIEEEKRVKAIAAEKERQRQLDNFQYWQSCFENGLPTADPKNLGYFESKSLKAIYDLNIESIRYCVDIEGRFFGKTPLKNKDGRAKTSYKVIICKMVNVDGVICAYQVLLHDKADIDQAKKTKVKVGKDEKELPTKKVYINPDFGKSGSFIPITPMPKDKDLDSTHVFCVAEGVASILSPYSIIMNESLIFQSIFAAPNSQNVQFHFLSGIDCGNLPRVFAELRKYYGHRPYIILFADCDDAGKEAALQGKKHDVISIFPEFAKCGMNPKSQEKYHAKDFNDLHCHCSLYEVIPSILETLKNALETNRQEKIAAIEQALKPIAQTTPQNQQNQNDQKPNETEQNVADNIQAETLYAMPEFERVRFSEFANAIRTIKIKDVLVALSPTGSGKSYTIARSALYLLVQKELVICILPTIKLARQGVKYAKKELKEHPELYPGITEKDIALECSKRGLTNEDNTQQKQYRGIIFTTYGYVGRFGDMPHGIIKFHDMIENRIVFCDEFQALLAVAGIQYPLAARYLGDDQDYHHVEYCPKTGKDGDCSKCVFALRKQIPRGRDKKRKFPKSFPNTKDNIELHQNHNEAAIMYGDTLETIHETATLGRFLEETSQYINIHGTLFFCEFPENLQDITTVPSGECTERDFVWQLRKTLVNPHIRTEFPILKKDGSPIKREQILQEIEAGNIKEKDIRSLIQFPKLPCQCPHLCGFDTFFFYQFMGMDVPRKVKHEETITHFMGAKAIVFTSATMPGPVIEQLPILEKNGRFNPPKYLKVADIPYQFRVTVLSEHKGFSVDRQAKLIERILDQDHPLPVKTFLVTGRKSEFDSMKKFFTGSDFEANISFFSEGFYQDDDDDRGEKLEAPENRNITMQITYCKSALCVGTNLPQYQLVILDCRQFIPLAALESLKMGMSPAQIKFLTGQDIVKKITQGCGRVLRSLIERTENTAGPIQDHKQIVILLHGLPEGINFDLDPSLLIPNTYRHIKATWYLDENSDRQDKVDRFTDSIMDSITKALQGLPIVNYKEIAEKEAAAKPKSKQSKQQRKLTTMTEGQQAAADAKQLEADFKKIVASKQLGLTYKEIAVKFNIARNPELRNKTKQLFNMPLDAD